MNWLGQRVTDQLSAELLRHCHQQCERESLHRLRETASQQIVGLCVLILEIAHRGFGRKWLTRLDGLSCF